MLEWVVTSSFLILVVLILRATLGKRISAGLRYALWAVVLVRLLVPVSSVTLSMTVPQLSAWMPLETMQEESIYVLPVYSGVLKESNVTVLDDGALGDSNSFGYPRLTGDGKRVVRYVDKISLLDLLRWVWIAGTVAIGAVLATANLRFSKRLRQVRKPLEGTSAPVPVYVAAGLPSPCLVGLFRPAIYVSEEAAAAPDMQRHVMVHELTHYNHLDHLWSALRGVGLAVHWWNPLVWLAVVCSRRDGELACDEGALKRLGDEERTAYGETLLALVTAKSKPGDLFCFATTMTGGKRSLKERIHRIAKRPKQLVSAMVVVIAVLSLSVLVAFGQVEEDPYTGTLIDPAEDDVRLGAAWKTAEISVDEDGVPSIHYTLSNGSEEMWTGIPIPAPREWTDEELVGRNEAAALQYAPEIRAQMVSPTEGWLVATYGRGVAAADTYVYKTSDRGVSWEEVAMPGTNWHISAVGFLSPERLIVAQRIFDGAPCFITRDGGESWEEIDLPDKMVTAIQWSGDTIAMHVGPNESDLSTYSMISNDLGDHWTIGSPGLSRLMQVDLDHDGWPDTLRVWKIRDGELDGWKLDFTAFYMSSPTWTDTLNESHGGCDTYFLYQRDGLDYLLEYMPKMQQGFCTYSYRLFHLESNGEEITDQEGRVEFDINFNNSSHRFVPEEITTFMWEINSLIGGSELLINTNHWMLNLEEDAGGKLRDNILISLGYKGAKDFSTEEDLLSALESFADYTADHPDDTWSPLTDLLLDLTEKDIVTFDGDASELVRMLRSAERGSRFYTWHSKTAAYLGAGADEVDYAIWDIPLADGSTLWLLACVGKSSVLMIYEMPDGAVSAFYTAPELKEWIVTSDIST